MSLLLQRKPYTLLQGDAREKLRSLKKNSARTCITSPPYYGLRAYGTNPQIWFGREDCEHTWITKKKKGISGGTKSEKVRIKGTENFGIVPDTEHAFCFLCDAWRGELGSEPTLEMYLDNLVIVFSCVKDALTEDGTLWIVIGDSYCPKTKSLQLVPYKLAERLKQDGWYLRNIVVWHKPNAFVTSVKDRLTVDYECILFLSKQKNYYYDREAILEPYADSTIYETRTHYNGQARKDYIRAKAQNPSDSKRRIIEAVQNGKGRNRRTVWFPGDTDIWTVTAKGFKGKHFATYPGDLIEPCILSCSQEQDSILDPFSGTGTTGEVAIRQGRKYIGIELNPDYVEISKARLDGREIIIEKEKQNQMRHDRAGFNKRWRERNATKT